MSGIRVLLVEDSPVVQEFLQHVIRNDPRLAVAGVAGSGEQALRMLERVSPDVIALDMMLPGMNGLEATRRIMAEKPTPIVLISASLDVQSVELTMQALAAGALAVIEKPVARGRDSFERLARQFCTQLAIMSQVRVIRQRVRSEWRPPAAVPAAADRRSYRALGLAASTGGPSALAEVLRGLGRDLPLPVLLVQHLTPTFLKGFGAWLEHTCLVSVDIVEDQAPPAPGKAYLAAPGRHLVTNGATLCAVATDPVCAHRPSATVLFRSMARSLRGEAIGVLLTGMGTDGAEGLLELRSAGGYTIAEDESTAVVYGMPAAGVRLGAVCESLPLSHIARRIRELVNGCAGDLS